MTGPRPPFDTTLESWLDEGPTVAPSSLFEAARDTIPMSHRQRRPMGTARRPLMFQTAARTLAAIAAVAVLVVAGFTLIRGLGPTTDVGGSPTPQPTDAAVVPTPTPVGTMPASQDGACTPDQLEARILSWDGAAGSRIATVILTNVGTTACETTELDRVRLVTDTGVVLLDGGSAGGSGTLHTLDAGDVNSTLVEVTNYCGPDVSARYVTLSFEPGTGVGVIVATPAGPTDLTGIPPCTGPAGSPGSIGMHPWQLGANPG